MAVPYTFGTATSSIPLSQLDSNFATAITLGNTAIQLGNTATTLNNMTLANVTIASGNVTLTNVAVTTANVTTANITTAVIVNDNVTNLVATSANVTTANVTTANITTANITNSTVSGSETLSGGTANGVAYLNGSKVVTTGSALTFDGTNLSLVNANAAYLSIQSLQSYINLRSTGAYNPFISFFSSTSTLEAQIQGVAGGGAMVFATGASPTEQMRLTSTGLGIGTSSPSAKLDVTGNGRFAGTTNPVKLTVTNTGGETTIARDDSTGSQFGVAYATNFFATGAYPMIFWTNGAERARIDASGNLALGTTSALGTTGNRTVATVNGTSSALISLGVGGVNTGTYYADANIVAVGAKANIPLVLQTNDTERARIDSSGNLLVGTTSSSPAGTVSQFVNSWSGGAKWGISLNQTVSSATSYTHINFSTNGTTVGNINANNTVTIYATSSDYRLKNITGPITTSGAYIDSLNPVEGTWKADGSTFVGLIAHEVQESSRTQVVTGTKDGAEMQAMDYSNSELIANLIAEIQSLRKRLAALEAK